MLRSRQGLTGLLTVALLLGTPCASRAAGVALPGTQPADGSGDPAFPAFENSGQPGRFDVPGICDNCHAAYREPGQRVYEPFDSWAGSMMAMAGRDPLFWAALDVANQDDAAVLGDVGVGDFCLRCHAPRAWYEGRSDCVTPWGQEFDGACLEGPPEALDGDFDGVFCHFCHRMYDASAPPAGEVADPLAPRGENAQLYLRADESVMEGPYGDADPRRHRFRQSAFLRSSAFCGECHDVTHPVLNRRDPVTGADLGQRMPVERTWSEYRQSAYADPASPLHETCQTCHMAQPDHEGDGVPDAGHACSQLPGLRGEDTTLEGPLRTHFFPGGSSWMLQVLAAELGVTLDREEAFQAAIEATLDLLTRRTVDLAVAAVTPAVAGRSVEVRATVTNRTGHKFPTGYPEGRRAWVNVVAGVDANADGVLDAAEVGFESAAYDAATATLTVDAQARVHELLVGVWDWNGTGQCDLIDDASGSKMFHFVLNDCIVADNRIPPLGFVPTDDTAPVAHVYPENPALPGTLANWDEVPYQVPVPPGTEGARLLVESTVFYQSTSREYVEFLLAENQSTCDPLDPGCDPTLPDARPNRGEKLHGLWERYGMGPPVALATARTSVAIEAPATGACCVGVDCLTLTAEECLGRGGEHRGDGVPCDPMTCEVPAPPPGEPSAAWRGGPPLLVTGHDAATGTVTVAFEPACDATDHAVVWGPLAEVGAYVHDGVACGFGAAGTAAFAPTGGSVYFVVVGTNGVVEGSYGRDSSGRERPERLGDGPCDLPRDLGAVCE